MMMQMQASKVTDGRRTVWGATFLIIVQTALIMSAQASPAAALLLQSGSQADAALWSAGMGHKNHAMLAFGFSPNVLPSHNALSRKVFEPEKSSVSACRTARVSPCGDIKAQMPNPFQTLFGAESSQDRRYHESRQRPSMSKY